MLLDLELPDSSGMDTFRRIHDRATGVPIIVLTGNADEELGIQAIHQGAQEYLVKGRDSATLKRAIRYTMSRHRLRCKLEKAAEFATATRHELKLAREVQAVRNHCAPKLPADDLTVVVAKIL